MTENNDVRLIKKSDFEKMVSGQRQFFLSLVEQGKAKIVDETPAAPVGKAETEKPRKQGPIQRLQGKKVIVLLSNDIEIVGTLAEIWQYETLLDTGAEQITIMKHAIITVKEVKE